LERRSFVRNAALVSAGILGSVPLLATPSSINISELSVEERKLLADYEQIVRKSTTLPEHQALRLLGAKTILRRDENGCSLKLPPAPSYT
jgi:hypothetical protein